MLTSIGPESRHPLSPCFRASHNRRTDHLSLIVMSVSKSPARAIVEEIARVRAPLLSIAVIHLCGTAGGSDNNRATPSTPQNRSCSQLPVPSLSCNVHIRSWGFAVLTGYFVPWCKCRSSACLHPLRAEEHPGQASPLGGANIMPTPLPDRACAISLDYRNSDQKHG
jgi:hypothetical protein